VIPNPTGSSADKPTIPLIITSDRDGSDDIGIPSSSSHQANATARLININTQQFV